MSSGFGSTWALRVVWACACGSLGALGSCGGGADSNTYGSPDGSTSGGSAGASGGAGRVACDSDNDCTPFGLLCNKANGFCGTTGAGGTGNGGEGGSSTVGGAAGTDTGGASGAAGTTAIGGGAGTAGAPGDGAGGGTAGSGSGGVPGTSFFDDFEDMDAAGWTLQVQPADHSLGNWTVALDGSYVFGIAAFGGGNNVHLAQAGGPWTDMVAEARIKVAAYYGGTQTGAQIAVRVTSVHDNYYLALQANRRLKIKKALAGVRTSLSGESPVLLEDGVWYSVRFEAIGSTLNAYLDGALLLTVTDDADFTQGGVAVGAEDVNAVFDDVSVVAP